MLELVMSFLSAEPGAGAKTRLTKKNRVNGDVFLICRTGGWREDPAD
jgi:hypothetical protein